MSKFQPNLHQPGGNEKAVQDGNRRELESRQSGGCRILNIHGGRGDGKLNSHNGQDSAFPPCMDEIRFLMVFILICLLIPPPGWS